MAIFAFKQNSEKLKQTSDVMSQVSYLVQTWLVACSLDCCLQEDAFVCAARPNGRRSPDRSGLRLQELKSHITEKKDTPFLRCGKCSCYTETAVKTTCSQFSLVVLLVVRNVGCE